MALTSSAPSALLQTLRGADDFRTVTIVDLLREQVRALPPDL
jgi:hypothetical protein